MRSSTLSPANTNTPADTSTTTPADREAAWSLIIGCTVMGLPLPEQIDLYSFHALYLKFDTGDTGAVDRWAAYLGLPAAARSERAHSVDSATPLTGYSTRMTRHPSLPGWSVSVSCSVPATADEIEAARVEVTK
ncbi:hypothetical protein [Micromonospora sp. DT227]|uniref:hypothetical protein n=1 Tax=Micromonospora sp. DT227 TaxID=3393433 RepID=UPI003CFB1C35